MTSRRRQEPGGSHGLQHRSDRLGRSGGFDSRPPPPNATNDSHPPSVHEIACRLATAAALPHALLVDIAREAVRLNMIDRVDELADALERSFLRSVLNGTGVLLHTNLGRAPAVESDQSGYTNLEISLDNGRRGPRSPAVTTLLRLLTGSEDAIVVNNGAAALLLVLTAVAGDKSVVVSRGELLEIGGGVRIPEMLSSSGARLVEVGTTNMTRGLTTTRTPSPPRPMRSARSSWCTKRTSRCAGSSSGRH